jgi:hypothetical protein
VRRGRAGGCRGRPPRCSRATGASSCPRFADGGVGYGEVADLLAPGGILVKDDLTPGRPVDGDATREALLRDPRLEAVEVLVTPTMACIVAVRRA